MNFEQYDNDNPQIWQAFVHYTIETVGKGFQYYGAKGIIELIRWHTPTTANGDKFKINNNFAPDYARKFMATFPQHEGFFRLRAKQS